MFKNLIFKIISEGTFQHCFNTVARRDVVCESKVVCVYICMRHTAAHTYKCKYVGHFIFLFCGLTSF